MVADWLSGAKLDSAGASQSVAVQLAAMACDGSDTAPTAPPVTDETRNSSAARGDYPAGVSGLQVSLVDLRVDTDTFSQTEQKGTLRVLIRYIGGNKVSADGLRDAYYVLRGVRRSLHRFHLPAEGDLARKRNNIALIPSATEAIEFVKVEAAREDDDVLTGLLVPYVWMELAV